MVNIHTWRQNWGGREGGSHLGGKVAWGGEEEGNLNWYWVREKIIELLEEKRESRSWKELGINEYTFVFLALLWKKN